MQSPHYWQEAISFLVRNDTVLAGLIEQYTGEKLMSRGSAFYSLARSIVGQQISVKAADSVWRKVEAVMGEVAPQNILALNDEILRSAGLSRQKILYLREISHFFSANPKVDWHVKDDEEVIKDLVSIKGIGRWSAEMFLIFHLLRADIFPVKDIGLQKAIEKHYNNSAKMPLPEMERLAEGWRPYRSVATWYLWRSLDPVPVAY